MLIHSTVSTPGSTLVTISSQQSSSTIENNNSAIQVHQIPVSGALRVPANSERKKARKTNPGILQSPRKLALEESGCSVVTDGSSENENKKRSRKQKIDTKSDTLDLTGCAGKFVNNRRKRAKKSSSSISSVGSSSQFENRVIIDSKSELVHAPSVSSHNTKGSKRHQLIQQENELNLSKLLDKKLSFTVFPDLSRNLAAIGPTQVLISVDSIQEPGDIKDLVSVGASGTKNSNCERPYSEYLSSPHYLPLTSVYSSGEPFSRVLRFSQLEEYTKKALSRNNVTTLRFYGPRFERQVPNLQPTSPKKNKTSDSDKDKQIKNGYRRSDLVIKHPILGFYTRKLVSLKFVILKRITVPNQPQRAVVRSKIVQLRRSIDLKNIEIYVDECDIPEIASDVNAMNQQNIHPVIQTSSGLIPVITRTAYVQQPHQHQQQYQYQFVQYQPAEIVQDDNDISLSNDSHYLLNQPTVSNSYVSGDYIQTGLRNENGGQVLIFNAPASSSSHLQVHHPHEQPLLQQEHLYQIEEQSVSLQHSQQHIIHQSSNSHCYPVQQTQQQSQFYSLTSQQQPIVPSVSGIHSEGKVIGRIILPADYKPGCNLPIRILGPGVEPNEYVSSERHISLPLQQLQQHHNQLHLQQQQTYSTSQVHDNHQVIVHQDSNCHPAQSQSQYSSDNSIHQIQYSTTSANTVQQQVKPIVSQQQHPPSQPQGQLHNLQIQQRSPAPAQLAQRQVEVSVQQHSSAAALSLQRQSQIDSVGPHTTFKTYSQQNSGPQQQQQNQTTTVLASSSPVTCSTQKGAKKKATTSRKSKKNEGLVITSSQPIPVLSPNQLNLQKPQPGVQTLIRKVFSKNQDPSVPTIVSTQSVAQSVSHQQGSPKITGVTSTASVIRLTSAAGGVVVAAKSQIPSTAVSSSVPTSPATNVKTLPGGFSVISPAPAAIASTPIVATDRPSRKPGFFAVCPHCGMCNASLVQCLRCKIALPENVKLVKDGGWGVNKNSAAVIHVHSTSPLNTSICDNKVTVVATGGINSNSVVLNPTVVKTVGKGGRKIVVVNKPQILTNSPVNKSVVSSTPGTVQIQIQKDGGSTVTIVNAPAPTSKPAPKKRAPARKRQQECITLSSDDEEPEPKPKTVKLEAAADSKKLVLVGDNTENQESIKTEIQVDTAVAVATPESNMPKKGLSINLSSDLKNMKKEVPKESPEQVLAQINEQTEEPGSKVQYVMIECRSIRVGSYKVTNADVGMHLPVVISELGIKFTLPYANLKHKKIKMCIPMSVILSVKGHFNKRLPVLFITTGPKYAEWVRETLGLDGNSSSETSYFYCPQNGGPSQKTITFLAQSIEEADIGIVKLMFKNVLDEIDYNQANSILMKITPQSYRSSIAYNSPVASPENSTSKSTSLVGRSNDEKSTSIPTADSANKEGKNEESKLGESNAPSCIVESDGVILLYEGRNNIKVPISPKDISCLGYSQFLNDQIIDFWLAVIQNEILSDTDRKRTFVFDSFFYSKLTEKVKKRTVDEVSMTAGERRHARVKKRTKNVDIFEKDFLIVPINENYHWFIAIVCFPGLRGFHDYESLTPLPNYKRPKVAVKPKGSPCKPIVTCQPKSESTASYSDRDEAPEDPEEMLDPDDTDTSQEGSTSSQSKSQNETDPTPPGSSSVVRKSDFGQRVKHPCILIFDSLAGDARGRVYSTLRDYLKVEYKTKKTVDRVFDKNAMPGCMPKVPQQPNFSDCGLFLLQYVESFFSAPIMTYEPNKINLKTWFESIVAENKRQDIFNFISRKVTESSPEFVGSIPSVSFEPDDDVVPDKMDVSKEDQDDDSENSLFEEVAVKKKKSSDSDDHNYAKDVAVGTTTDQGDDSSKKE